MRLVYPDAFADSLGGNTVANSFDDAGAVAVRDDRAIIEQIRIGAGPFLDVRGIDAAGVETYQHFAVFCNRRRKFTGS